MKKLTTSLTMRRSVATVFGRDPRPARPHFSLLSSMSVTAVGLILAQPAMADVSCPTPNSSTSSVTTCTVDSSASGNLTVDYTGPTGTGTNGGGYGGNYIVVNNGYLGPSPQQAVLLVRLKGGTGSPDGDDGGTFGGWGGTITITSNESIYANGTPTEAAQGSAPGVWDDSSGQFGIYGASVGGTGGTPPDDIGGGSGGSGGNGSPVTISNNDSVTLVSLPYGGVGIYGASIGGLGADQMSAATGDQVGGNGGNSDIVNITNNGSVSVSSNNAGRYAWGVGAESIGGAGGVANGWGGTGGGGNPDGTTIVTNNGKVDVQVEIPGSATSNLLTNGVRGLYATSQGNAGFASTDGSDNGGAGGGFGTVAAVNNGQITVTSYSVPAPTTLASLSGGIVVVGLGGNGGDGPDTITNTTGEIAGVGGTSKYVASVTLNNGSSITTTGDYLPGVSVVSQGGNGGAGREDSNGADGGKGGPVQIGMNGTAKITTYGAQSHGIAARSYGGGGGGVLTSSGLVDFTPENAGVGGAGGTVTVATGDASANVAGGTIVTQGSNAIGILGQSMGGIGGTTTGNFELFGDAGANAGSGGASGTVNIDSLTTISTFGSSAHGIVGQAIGGGGGTAGPSSGIIAVGGAGGSAVAGGTVTVTQGGNLSTSGSAAIGILTQSIGGGGGDGGGANGVAVIGGSAGGGGAGGNSTAKLTGYTVSTGGDHAYGIVSQAIGGGGGTGGAASAYDAGVGFSMAVAVGGTGGGGGSGGVAQANVSNASVKTSGSDAHGVIAQSIGGGGGAGGASVAQAMTIAVPTEDASFGVAVSFAMGGTGGSGGSGNSATATLTNAGVSTQGANAQGVIVQAIGGGGGMGGSASATSTVIGTGESIGGSLQASLGGSGGSGNTGGSATLTMTGSNVSTMGDSANGVLVQSVGGGGGAGGVGSATGRSANTDANVSISMALGGTGNTGGFGGLASLTIDSASSVTTHGDGARAVLVQSIGGGGGASQGGQVGLEVQATEEDSTTDFNGSVEVGGGGGGDSGVIDLNSDGNITTYGADADGLLVQSIGGSGGLGGAVGGNSATTSPLPSVNDSGTTYQFHVYVGGTGAGSGSGGDIGSSSAPAILGAYTQTYGDYADAAVVQSIGGGGGAGGASTVSSSLSTSNVTLAVGGRGGGGGGGAITAALNDDGGNGFNTAGYGAAGIVLQSIGGGGGMAGSGSPRARGQLLLGGMSGDGESITVTPGSWANIETKGDSAYGLVAQSIGGGGGIAMAGSAGSAATPGSLQFGMVAGNSGGGGFGSSVKISTGLSLNTYGDRAMGVIAQSIGSGGGIATSGAADGVSSLQLGSQRNTGLGSSAGGVRLDLTGSVTTRGAGAHGIVAQSIGGGGGIIGDVSQAIQFNSQGFNRQSVSVNSEGGGGNIVNVSFNGSLITSGANAHGIVAQSVGGGGGLAGGPQGGFAGAAGQNGTASPVSVEQWGTLNATGEGSAGVFAQSDGQARVEPVGVVVNGDVQGGSGSGSGVWIAAGKKNQLAVRAGASVGALSGVAVRYDGYGASSGSRLTIDNAGKLAGSTLCHNGDGSNACILNNQAGAVATDAVAYNADVHNDGLIVIGKPGQFQTLTVSGSLTQSGSGVLRADVDFDKLRSSRMVVEGDASLAGGIDALPQALLPNRELSVVTVQGSSQGALTAVDSPVYDYEARQIGPDTRIRVASANFSAPSMELKGNQSEVAGHLQRIWNAGGNSALAPLFAQLDLASRQGAGAYGDSVANLSPGVTIAPAVQSAANLGQFTGAMMSCPTFTGVDALTGEQNCFWGQVTGRATNQDGSRGTAGFDYDTVTYQFGGQREVSPGWFLGGSVAYENSHVRASDGSVRGNGDSGYAGVVLKREEGPWVFSAALGGGYGGYRMDRDIDIAGYQDTLTSRPDVYGFNARLRAARTFAYSNMYVKPYVDLDFSYSRMPAYTESGSNPLALSVDSSDRFIMGVSPMIEFGGRSELKNGAMLRPFLYAGVSFLSQDDWTSSARLRGAPAGTGSFDTTLPIDDVVGRVGAGLQVMNAGGVDFRLQYDGQFSEHVRSNSATLKVMVPF